MLDLWNYRHIYEDSEGVLLIPSCLHLYYKNYFLEIYQPYQDNTKVYLQFSGSVHGWKYRTCLHLPFIYKNRELIVLLIK